MRRLIPLLVLCSCGALGMSSEQREQLYLHQRNAKLYKEGRHYAEALDQIRRGLEIAPDDYQLHLVRSYCLLSMAQESNDPVKLAQAAESFDKLRTLRSSEKLEPQAHLGYALVQQRLGMEQRAEAERVREELKRTSWSELERTQREAKAAEHERKATAHMQTAERELNGLAANGDLPLLAHYHLLQIHALANRYQAAISAGMTYLELASKQQERHQQQIQKTTNIGSEKYQRSQLQELVDQEIEVRALVAHLYWQTGEHQKSVEQLNRVLTLDPARSVDYYNRGRNYRALGKHEEMKRDFKKFIATTKLPPGAVQVTEAYAALRDP